MRKELQAIAVAPREGQAQIAHCLAEHEGDGLRRGELRREHQVSFVFAVFVIDENDHFAGAEVCEDVGKWGEGHRRRERV